jgi:hypothetical protein
MIDDSLILPNRTFEHTAARRRRLRNLSLQGATSWCTKGFTPPDLAEYALTAYALLLSVGGCACILRSRANFSVCHWRIRYFLTRNAQHLKAQEREKVDTINAFGTFVGCWLLACFHLFCVPTWQ